MPVAFRVQQGVGDATWIHYNRSGANAATACKDGLVVWTNGWA